MAEGMAPNPTRQAPAPHSVMHSDCMIMQPHQGGRGTTGYGFSNQYPMPTKTLPDGYPGYPFSLHNHAKGA